MNNKSCQYSPLKELLIRHSSGEMDACEREFTTCLRVYRAAGPSVRLLDASAAPTEAASAGTLGWILLIKLFFFKKLLRTLWRFETWRCSAKHRKRRCWMSGRDVCRINKVFVQQGELCRDVNVYSVICRSFSVCLKQATSSH